jgi:hypothetical protein
VMLMLVHTRTLLCAYMHAHTYLLAVTLKHSHSHINALVHRYAHTRALLLAVMCTYTSTHSMRNPYTTDTVLKCPAGEQMLMNMITTPTIFDAWKIDCNSVQSMYNGTRYYARTTHSC